MRKTIQAGLVALALALAGCDAFKKLFAEKPRDGDGPAAKDGGRGLANGEKAPPDGQGAGKEDGRGGAQEALSAPVAERFRHPRGTAVGAWARWRITIESVGKTYERELALLARQGDRLWVEETSTLQGFEEVTWRLVSPEGKVLAAFRGKAGEAGVPAKVDPAVEVHREPLEGAKEDPRAKAEAVTVPAGRLECKKLALEDGAAWVSDQVPFDGLVKSQQGAEGDGVSVVLLGHGRDRTRGKLTRSIPEWKPGK